MSTSICIMLSSNKVKLRTIGRGGIAPEMAQDVSGMTVDVYVQ